MPSPVSVEGNRHDRSSLQRLVPMHRQFGALDPRLSGAQPRGSRKIPRFLCRFASEGRSASLHAATAQEPELRYVLCALERNAPPDWRSNGHPFVHGPVPVEREVSASGEWSTGNTVDGASRLDAGSCATGRGDATGARRVPLADAPTAHRFLCRLRHTACGTQKKLRVLSVIWKRPAFASG